jgi:hypothetical protein
MGHGVAQEELKPEEVSAVPTAGGVIKVTIESWFASAV